MTVSRYDWGQRHPGIDRLEEQIGAARRAVIEHPVYAALDSAGAQCAAFRRASNFRVEGRAVRFGPFRGTIGPEGGLRMIYGQSTVVGHFAADSFRGVATFQVPPCQYAMALRRVGE